MVYYSCMIAIHSYINFILYYSRTIIIQALVMRISSYPDRFDPSGKFVENCKN
jgi:hypothetical protein